MSANKNIPTVDYPKCVQLLINNRWQNAADNQTLAVENPATGQILGHVARAHASDIEAAAQAAWRGFEIWRRTSAHERQRLMRTAAALLRERVDAIAVLMTLEQGKPLAEARAEILAAAGILEWFADEALRLYGRIVPARKVELLQQVIPDPVGPVAAFTPWNFPINQIVRKLGAALAAGCSVVCKAPEETPASPAALMQCFVDAGLPEGVLGLLYGQPAEISSALIAHPHIRKITFTGSTAVGRELAALAAQHMKRSTMELGGHAPVIVMDDADVALAAAATCAAKLRNAGQVCIAPTRFLVHERVAEEFEAHVIDFFAQVRVGNGLDAATRMGPLANPRRSAAMRELVADAQHCGARLAFVGQIAQDPQANSSGGSKAVLERGLAEDAHKSQHVGNFYPPTILADVPLSAAVFNQEPFGPVLALRTFSQLDQAIAEANRLPYGLAAYAFTRSLAVAGHIGRELYAGMVWLNQGAMTGGELPFGGVRDSGWGSEGGPEALAAYVTPKLVSMAMV